jgi:predicted MFS family arabinose efflux permease
VARHQLVVRRVLITIFTFSLISLNFIGQLPVVAERNLGIDERSSAYGALYACFGIGAVIGALSIGTVFSQSSKERITRLALVGFAAALTVFALRRGAALAYPVILAVGLCYFGLITSLSTILQQHLADHERGRVMALWIMGFGGTVPIGNLVAGPHRRHLGHGGVAGRRGIGLGLSGYARLGDESPDAVTPAGRRAARARPPGCP